MPHVKPSKQHQERKCTLEQFIFNCASCFLTKERYFFFQLFVLQNRSTNLTANNQKNNVFNHSRLYNFCNFGQLDEKTLQTLDLEERENGGIEKVNDDVRWLFNNGFIQRNTTYQSKDIGTRTQLTFRPYQFVRAMHTALRTARETTENLERHETLTKGAAFVCTAPDCAIRTLSIGQQNQISAQLTKTTLDLINCPNCFKLGTLKKRTDESGEDQSNVKLTRNIIKELYFQSIYLLRQIPGISDSDTEASRHKYSLADIAIGQEQAKDTLERELRAMRAQHNKKINFYRKESQQQIIWPDRSHIFLKEDQTADDAEDAEITAEQQHSQKLANQAKGMNPDSVINNIGPVFKAPRFYQAGAGTGGRPEWLTRVVLKANKVLYGE